MGLLCDILKCYNLLLSKENIETVKPKKKKKNNKRIKAINSWKTNGDN